MGTAAAAAAGFDPLPPSLPQLAFANLVSLCGRGALPAKGGWESLSHTVPHTAATEGGRPPHSVADLTNQLISAATALAPTIMCTKPNQPAPHLA